jgi:hypothetical protein
VLRAGDAAIDVEMDGRPGAVVLDGLEPDANHELVLEHAGERRLVERFRTLDPPPGRLLTKFATISDMHIGERAFGMWPRFREDLSVPRHETYTVRCARSAITEATAWGASRLLAKGDLTWSGRAWQWDLVAEVLSASPVPVHAVMGNHDVGPKSVDGRAALVRRGIEMPLEPVVVDLDGIRIVLGHTADRGHERGVVDDAQRAALVKLVGSAGTPVFLGMHHYVDRLPWPSRYPVGIRREAGGALMRELAATNPRLFVSSGHTHRNRRSARFGFPMTEVGSTKDYPGVWAGYAVHEGGIRQVVRRVSDPACLEWTEPTKGVLGGLWRYWSPGRRSWRCFTHRWP